MKRLSTFRISDKTNEFFLLKADAWESYKVEDQVMAVFILLYENEGQMVSKEKFVEVIWDGNNLTGGKAVTKTIFKLREFLRDHKIEELIEIETIPKKGYRLNIKEKDSNIQRERQVSGKARFFVMSVIGLLLIASAVWIFIPFKHQAKPLMIVPSGEDTIIFLDGINLQTIEVNDSSDIQEIQPLKNIK